jgi:uncharacterized protein YecT (DUF1311 family)
MEASMAVKLGFVLSLFLLAFFGLLPQDAKNQSLPKKSKDPCDSAMTQLELNNCSGDQYRKADAHLNALYGKLMHLLEEDIKRAQNEKDEDQRKNSETAIRKLKATEKAWIVYRDLQCDAARFEYEGGSINPSVWAICMKTVTEHRISDLKDAYETPDRKIE